MADLHVRYFAAAAESAGRDEEVLTDVALVTLGDLRAHLQSTYGESMRRVLRSGSMLVDGVVSTDAEHPLGRRVDVLPPFAGG